MKKIKRITLHGPFCDNLDHVGFPSHYRVVKIINSTAFDPQQHIPKRMVDDLCASSSWEVTIMIPER